MHKNLKSLFSTSKQSISNTTISNSVVVQVGGDIILESEYLHFKKVNLGGVKVRSRKRFDKLMKHYAFPYMKGIPSRHILAPIDLDVSVNNNENMPLKQCLLWMQRNDVKNVQILGEGGMGKTSSLLCLWQELCQTADDEVPAVNMVSLHEVNDKKKADIEEYVLRSFAAEFFTDSLVLSETEIVLVKNELNAALESTQPKYLLLLDGFNEVKDDFKLAVVKQIKELTKYENLQIIITSRQELNALFNIYPLHKIELKPLSDEKITAYLQINHKDISDARPVWPLLSNPMMLTVYCNTNDIYINYSEVDYFQYLTPVQTKGELISNYLESLVSKRYIIVDSVIDIVLDIWYLYFVLPQIAQYMEERHLFALSSDSLRERLQTICEINADTQHFVAHFYSDLNLLKEWKTFFDSGNLKQNTYQYVQSFPSVFKLLEESWFFTHQSYRDFLSARNVILGCKRALYDHTILPQKPLPLDRSFSVDMLQFMGDMLQDYKNSPFLKEDKWAQHINKSDVLHKLIERFRHQPQIFYFHALYNIIQIWKISRGGIEGEDFSGLDLKNLVLSPYIHGKDKGICTFFNESVVYKSNFFPQGHTDEVLSVCINSKIKRVVTASKDHTARIWDAETGSLLHTLEGHYSFVMIAKFSPDGNHVITTSREEAWIWDTQTGALLRTLSGHSDDIIEVEYDLDGKRVITNDCDFLRIWDAQTGFLLQTLMSHHDFFNEPKFSPDGKRIITVSDSDTACIWATETGTLLNSLNISICKWETVKNVNFSPDGKCAIMVSKNSIFIFDSHTGTLLHTLENDNEVVKIHGIDLDVDVVNEVIAVQFSLDEKCLIAVSHDLIRIWDAETGIVLQKIHSGHSVKAQFSSDRKRLITISQGIVKIWDTKTMFMTNILEGQSLCCDAKFSTDGTQIITNSIKAVQIWDTETGALLHILEVSFEDSITALFNPTGTNVITASKHIMRIWDVDTRILLHTVEGLIGSAEFSPNGKYLVAIYDNQMVQLWDVENGVQHHIVKVESCCYLTTIFSPDSKYLIIDYSNWRAEVWDVETRKLLHVFEDGNNFYMINLNRDGNRVIIANRKIARIWDVGTGTLLHSLEGHTGDVLAVKFSPDKKHVITASCDMMRIWDIETGTLLNTLGMQHVTEPEYSSDGKRVITIAHDNLVRVWDAETESLLFTLEGHDKEVIAAKFCEEKLLMTVSSDKSWLWNSQTGDLEFDASHILYNNATIEFSPDGKRVATISNFKAVLIWDIETGGLLSLKGHSGWINTIKFSSNGKRVVTFSDYNTLRIFNAETGDLLNSFQSAITPELSLDRKLIATVPCGKIAHIWEVETATLLYSLALNSGIETIIFSPDGKQVLTTSLDETVRLWELQNNGGEIISEFKHIRNQELSGCRFCNAIFDQSLSQNDIDILRNYEHVI